MSYVYLCGSVKLSKTWQATDKEDEYGETPRGLSLAKPIRLEAIMGTGVSPAIAVLQDRKYASILQVDFAGP